MAAALFALGCVTFESGRTDSGRPQMSDSCDMLTVFYEVWTFSFSIALQDVRLFISILCSSAGFSGRLSESDVLERDSKWTWRSREDRRLAALHQQWSETESEKEDRLWDYCEICRNLFAWCVQHEHTKSEAEGLDNFKDVGCREVEGKSNEPIIKFVW